MYSKWDPATRILEKITPVTERADLAPQFGREELSPVEHLCVAQTWLLSNVRLANT